MYHKKSEKGQALVIIALAVVGLVAFTALAIDGGMVFSDRRHAQNAADTAAFAAALAKIRTPDYAPSSPAAQRQAAIDAGLDRADSNGYDNNGTTNVVEVHMPPISGSYVGNDDYIQVIITSHVRMMFAQIVGWQVVTNKVEAVTRAHTGSSDTATGLAAISALSPNGIGIDINGNVTLNVINSGIFSNSNSGTCPAGSMVAVGNGTFTVETGYTYASGGILCQTGNIDIDENQIQSGSQIPYPQGVAHINPPTPSITCSPDPITVTGNTINPGTATGQFSIPSMYGAYTFAPGNYCFANGANLNGDYDFTANDVNFRIDGGSFTLNGSSSLGSAPLTSCNNVLFHSVGAGTGVNFLGNSTSNCSNVTFYMTTGTAFFSGVADNTLSAPTSGDYKGLLIFQPLGNSTTIDIQGNSNQHYTGSIIGLSAPIHVAGNNQSFAVNSQFVGYTFTVSGNINFTVNYDPALQYLPPESPGIELIE